MGASLPGQATYSDYQVWLSMNKLTARCLAVNCQVGLTRVFDLKRAEGVGLRQHDRPASRDETRVCSSFVLPPVAGDTRG